MGWAWRSSESYGDKDESDKKPDAASSDATEHGTAGREEKSSWWDQFHDSPASSSDDYLSDWRGYQGATHDTERYYSYDQSIDDSDERWYRKSSFRYGRYADYSPSSLFRSAFYSPKSSYFGGTGALSEENEAKNKAIRALRTLSRNANTVCDKNAKISYAVQYSNGADVNSFEDTLIDGKAIKTIYVSPDSVVESKTTEEEDAAVDALTGFVLLRVQIAQEFDSDTITKINNTTMRALPARIVDMLRRGTVATPAGIATEHVDACLSGMLSKGILTRLARRHVVKDWGGFAPYFVRHAKKFTAIREKLEQAELSAESIVGKIAYNMIDDENAFEMDPEIDKIVAKHLGEEVSADKLLASCQTLISELREYLKKITPDGQNSAGPVESGLRDMLEEFMAAHAAANAAQQHEKDTAEQMLNEFAQTLDEQFMCAEMESQDAGAEFEDAADVTNELNALYAAEQMNTALKNAAKELEKKLAGLKAAVDTAVPGAISYAKSYTDYEQVQLDGKWRHFEMTRKDLEKRGATGKFTPADYMTTDATKAPELVAKEIEDLEKIVEEYREIVKRDVAAIREKILAQAKQYAETQEAHKKAAAEQIEKLREHHKSIEDIYDKAEIESDKISSIAAAAETLTKLADTQYKCVNASRANTVEGIENARGAKNLRAAYENLKATAVKKFNYDPRDDFAYRTSDHDLCEFVRNGVSSQHQVAMKSGGDKEELAKQITKSKWRAAAIKRFVQNLHKDDGMFKAHALNEAIAEVFEQLEKLFNKSGKRGDGENRVPGCPGDIADNDLREKVANLAQSVGLDAEELLQLFHKIDNPVASTLGETGKEIGRKIREILPLFDAINPVDNQLFGEVVSVQTKILADATKQVNDEARNDPEEDYVAYLSHCETKPTVHVVRPRVSNHDRLEVQASRTRQRNVITKIREALAFHNSKRTGEVYGVRSGDLDEGGLHKLGYDCEHIWSQKTVAQIPDVAVGILVDQSGSMSSGTKIYQAREMCIALAEAVKKIPGIHLHIYGHTANTRNLSDLTLFEHYSSMSDTGAASADLSRLGTIDALSNNYDGYAIKETAKLLAKDPAKRKYLFVIADGLPHGDGYCGAEAEKHVTSVCKFVRERLKIATYAFAVGVSGAYRNKFVSQYGKDNVVFLTEVHSCLPQITRFLRNSIQKEKTLVEIGT